MIITNGSFSLETNEVSAISSAFGTVYASKGAPINISAGTTSNNLSAFTFSNAVGGVSFGLDGSTITASAPAAAPSPVNFSAGTTSSALGSVVFSNSNGVSFGLNGSTITATVATNYLTTAAQSDHSHGNPTLNLTNLSGTTASNSAGLTLSLSAAAAGGGNTLSAWHPYANAVFAPHAISNASLVLAPVNLEYAFQCDRIVLPVQFSQSTASTMTMSNTVWIGLFTRNGNSLSMMHSTSGSFSINASGTASSASNSGPRLVSFPYTTTISPNNYVLGVVWRSSSAGGANMTMTHYCMSQINSSLSGYLGAASGTRLAFTPGAGVWTSTTTGIPASLHFSDIRGNSSVYQRFPVVFFTSQEITF